MKKLHISKIDADTIEYGDISTESKFDFTKVTIKDEYTLQLFLNLVLMFDRVTIGKQETDASTFLRRGRFSIYPTAGTLC